MLDSVVLVAVDVELPVVVVAARVGPELVVIWASPTPAAAANTKPTIAPIKERRVRRLNRLRMGNSSLFSGEY